MQTAVFEAQLDKVLPSYWILLARTAIVHLNCIGAVSCSSPRGGYHQIYHYVHWNQICYFVFVAQHSSAIKSGQFYRVKRLIYAYYTYEKFVRGLPEKALASGSDNARRTVPIIYPTSDWLPKRREHNGRSDDRNWQTPTFSEQHAFRQGFGEGVSIGPVGYQFWGQLLHEAVVHPRRALNYLFRIVRSCVDLFFHVLAVTVAVCR